MASYTSTSTFQRAYNVIRAGAVCIREDDSSRSTRYHDSLLSGIATFLTFRPRARSVPLARSLPPSPLRPAHIVIEVAFFSIIFVLRVCTTCTLASSLPSLSLFLIANRSKLITADRNVNILIGKNNPC